jgi:exonuclease SbcC
MKPLKLEFEGINSFSEHTIIDFEALTKTGLFGIFGDTGSGKSTILDCINFALYGSVERSKEKSDIINYRSSAASVKFTFNIINEGKRKIYCVERVLKKDRYGTHKAALYETDGEQNICLADKASAVEKKIAEIIGVEAEDFRKCIALPQGEFARFVKSAPRERLALIERLFSLSKYGDRLKEKINALNTETEGAYQNVCGRLQAYEEVTENALNQAYMGVNLKSDLFSKQNKEAEVLTEKCEKLKKLYESRAELDAIEAEIVLLREKQGEIDNLRKDFSALPVCKEIVAQTEQKTAKLNDIRGAIEKISQIGAEIDKVCAQILNVQRQLSDGNFEKEISECERLSLLYESSLNMRQRLENFDKSLNAKRQEYRKKEEEINALNAQLGSAQSLLSEAEKQLAETPECDFSKIVNVGFKGAVLKGEYEKSLEYFTDFGKNIKVYQDGSLLYKYVSGEVNGKISEYRTRVQDVKDFSSEDALKQLNGYQNALKDRELKQKRVNSCRESVQKLTSAIEIKKNEISASIKEGAELKEAADSIRGELAHLFGENCKDFGKVIDDNNRKLELLKHRKEELAGNFENLRKAKTDLEINAERYKTIKQTAEKEVEFLSLKIAERIKDSKLGTLENCIELAERFESLKEAENVLKDYDGKFALLLSKTEELKKTNGILTFKEEEYAECKQQKSDILGGVAVLSGEIAVLKKECEILEKRLKEKCAIQKEYNLIENKRTLLARLKEVTKNNKFMEYIAEEYLCDVSAIASSILLKLNDGRYFLTYKDNNFYVGDNFDCGNLRGVNTLSGGETFLVSLSLALALSQTICAKSMKSIEFFFLDEGFGTLDSSLVDTVMDALEKLKSSDFTIGIISHVEELKNRIDSKITVIKATESRGSTVNVSC